jgi:site-specific recombinase XerD
MTQTTRIARIAAARKESVAGIGHMNVQECAKVTIRATAASYFQWKDVASGSEHSRRAYHYEITRLAQFIGEDAPVDALNRFSLQRFAVELYNSGLAIRSRARALYYARDFVRWTWQNGIYPDNFAVALKPPRIPNTIPKVPTAEEVNSLLEGGCPTNWPERDLCMMELLYCNLRVCELVRLDIADITGDTLLLKGKGKRERTVFLTPSAQKAVAEYLPSRRLLLGMRETAALVVNRRGERMAVRSVGRLLKVVVHAKGLPGYISPVKLRAAYATHMLDGGAPFSAVRQLLGHENLSTTMHYVGDVNWKRMRESYDRTFKR